MEDVVRMQVKINAEADRIFKALTDSQAVVAWFAEYADIAPDEKQYDFWGKFTPEAPDRETGKHPITAYESDQRVQYRWHVHEIQTEVDFRVITQPDHCLVALTHTGGSVGSHQLKSYNFEDFWFLSLENLRRYVDGKPCEARVDFSQPMTGNIEYETVVDAPADRVFEVLIKPEELNRWIASKARVEPKMGGDFELGWKGVPALKIIDLDEGKKLSYGWPEATADGGIKNTVVTWTLQESGGKTRLTFVHSGFAPDDPTGGIKAGWRNFVNWVRSVAEYDDNWQPPLIPLADELLSFYPAAIGTAQNDLIFTKE